ncbi:MAG TPA: PIG-L deacetylase family protein [Devosia sp.]|jgi:LmbE family N-acetylglucosaminyl deacetylase|uniref:PIG-L deacetylase family protein n=1 Tax=Devosia sp. TaxID=1871048 RepID=UPI002DDDB37F|nr:PIG-L deacetylase family protein [Devosia sp.]HEV2517172.1 PIG-L deacetylase family protein [Devosia sp.]
MSYPLKVLVVKAHPDEAEMYAGGTTRRLADRGVAVKYLSLTNGDAGHYKMEREPLKRRRAREAYAAARHLGVVDYEILDIHDGELMPDLAVRTAVISSIRRWQADIVITFHDDCPGHLDNRAAGRAVRDASDFCTNGNICPEVPPLAQAPICLKMIDYGALNVHKHDIVIDVGTSIEAKLRACAAHATQFFEFTPHERGVISEAPQTGDWPAERAFILKYWPEFMYSLPAMSGGFEFAESFELADYGRRTSAEEVLKLFAL